MSHSNDLPEPTFLSSPKVATICGVTRNTVCCWIRDGKLPSYRTAGGKNLIRPADLLAFMKSNNMFVPDALTDLALLDNENDAAISDGRITTNEPAILIVDDDSSARAFITRCLSKLDLPLLEAETGFEALHILLQRPDVALVVLDMVMPGQHGSKTFTEIRRQYPGMPVIVVTGFPVEEMSEKFTEQRPELMLSKPFQASHLIDAARAFLSDVGI